MKNFNLIEMLQGCSKRNGTAVYASNPDGQPTVNRQSRLTSYPGEMNEKEQMSSTCPRFALVLHSFCSRLDSLSLVSRQSDLGNVCGISALFSTRVWKHAAIITLLLTLACGNVWGATYTWDFTTSSKPTISSKSADFTSTSGSKTITYIGGSSDGWNSSPQYLKMNGKSSVSSNLFNDRYFSFKAPSSSGTVTINYAGTASDALILTGSKRSIILTKITGTASTSVTSSVISGLTAGTTDLYIAFPENKSYINSITWTEAADPTDTRLYYSVVKTTMETGASLSASSASQQTGGGTGWTADFSNYYKTSNSTGSVTITFGTPLSLNSNGSNRGRIRIYGWKESFALKVNGSSAGTMTPFAGTNKSYLITVLEYTIPDGTNTLSSIQMTGNSGNSGGGWFAVEVLTHPGSSCTAPSSVGISGTNKYLAGQDINLTATPTGHTGTPTYQWQKEINSVWTNVTNGDNISGATTNILQITGCDHYNSGQYRCVVSTGSESCTTNSDAFGVHVFTVYGGYVGDTWSDSEIRFSAGTSGTATVHLNAGSLYKFHVRSNNGAYYCNGEADYNGDGNADGGSTDGWYTLGSFSNWSFGRSSRNFRIYTGAEGDYLITVDIANALTGDYVTVSVTYPTPTHPSEGYAYFEKPNDWNGVKLYWYTDNNSRLTSWDGSPEITATTTICGTTYYYTPLGTTFSNVIFRDKGSNQWTSLATSGFSGKYLDKTTYGSPAWASFTTYTISFNAGGGEGTMSSITGICPNGSQTLPANTFEKTGYTFAGWKDASSNDYADEATISSITSNITLTAQWSPVQYDVTLEKGSAPAAGSSGSAKVYYDAAALTNISHATWAGHVLTGYYTSNSGGTKVLNADGTFAAANVSDYITDNKWTRAENTTVKAQWTAKTTTITIDANTANHGSTAPSPITATYGSALPSFTAAAGVSGYSLTGYFTAPTSGTKVINADGTLVASTSYADGSSHWNSEVATLTLYAQYEEEPEACYEFDIATSGSAPAVGDAVLGTGDAGMTVAGLNTSGSMTYNSYGIKFNASGDKLRVVLPNNMKEGTVISIKQYSTGNGSNRGITLKNSSDANVTDIIWNPSGSAEENTITYTVTSSDGLKNTNTFYLVRKTNSYLKNVTVSNCGDAACTTPATAFANGAYTVGGSALDLSTLISGKQGTGAITYTVKNANGTGASIDGSNFTATSAGTATVTATQAADATYCEKVMDATITVSAGDVTAPTFVSSVPANGATGVATSGTIVLTFSEALGSVEASKFTLTGATKGAVAIDGSDATKVNIAYSGAANSTTVTLATAAAAVSDLAGNALASALSNISFTTAAAAPAGDCITIAYFETTSHSNSSSKPDNAGKYIYGYTNSAKTEAYAYTITSSTGDNKGQGTGESDYLRMNYGTTVTIYADNTTTGGTPASFSNVTSVSVDFKMKNSAYYTSFDIYVGSTKIANNVSLEGAAQSAFTTFTYDNLEQLSGTVRIVNKGSGSSNYHFYVDNIEICTSSLPACTTPELPTLTAKTVCEGGDADAAWNAAITNSGSLVSGETVAYSWVKKGGSTPVSSVATYQPTDVTEAMAGTYVVTATVSADGKASKSASQEVNLSVTEGTEAPTVTQSTTPVYEGNSVTLTATATTGATYTWHTCNADGTGESSAISGATTNAYTIASADAAGTYYYKVKVTGDGTHTCGNAETVYALTVSEAAGGDCFHFESVIPESNINISSGASIVTPTHATTLEGGTMKVGSQQVVITAGYGLKMEGTKTVSITLDAALEAGNVVIVKGTSGTKGYGITINGVNFYDADNKTFDVSYTVLADDGLVGQTALTVSKYSGNSYLQEVKITGCGESCTDPEVTASADNTTACVGTSVTCTATGAHAEATYQWQKLDGTWTNISGATASTYNIPSVVAGDAGKYRVIASHACSRTSNEVTLSVPTLPDFGSTVPSSVSVMQTIALSINTVEATDAVKYRWYKSADGTWDAGDVEIGTNKELIKAYDSEATGSPSYYIFCRAQNACGITTSTAIAVNVTAYVEEDCATRGNEGDAAFSFENSGCGQGTYNSASCWTMNSNSKKLIYAAPEGKYFKTMKVTIASSSASKASYNWSTNGGTTFTEVAINSINTTLTEKTIDVSAHGNVNALQIGRNLDGKGESSGTLYVSKICFEYTEACTATTVTPDESSKTYEMGSGSFTEPTFTVKHGGTEFDPQPTLTYSSSNEDIASVDDDGTVTFNGDAGTVTITASYAGGTISETEYCASQGSYTITVSCSGGAPKVVPDGTVNMSGCNASVTLNAKKQDGTAFADGTYQWFRNGEEIDGATSSSYTATQAGTYTVERTNASDCTTPSTNSAIVTSETTEPEVERLVPFQYYHVNKDYSDQMKMRHLFAVKNSGTLDGKHFKMYVSRNGGVATDVTSSNALVVWPNGDGHVDTVMVDLNKLNDKYTENDELVFTCKAIDCSGNVSDVYKNTITMNVIGTTPTLALICSGSSKAGGTRKTSELTVGGDFLTGYNVADLCQQTGNTSFDANTEWGLYTDLKAHYIVTPVNGYAVFNKLNYEPFDILLLTDYPKASKSDAAKDVLDDMAALCDYRPMLSFKTHMVAKSPSKWAEKGFTTSPVVTKADGRLNLNIVCYAHPMFEGLKSGEDVYEDADNTSAPLVYTMLTGGGYESSKGMQGFELAAAENFVTIGLTHYNGTITKNSPLAGEAEWTPGSEDRMLVTVAERQTNIEARFILFSLNCGAQSKLTDRGEQVILACLEYLLDDDPLHVADCSFTFDNGASNEHDAAWYTANCNTCTGTKGDGKWTTAANWGPDYRLLPGEFTSVRIKKPVEVDDTHAHVMEVRIIDEGRIDIPAGKALDVKSTIRRMDGTEIYPTEENDIHIGSASTGNGTLIFNNDDGDTKARVDMYSTAKADMVNMSAANSTWQYIGTPHSDVANARYNYYNSWLYQYSGSGWEVIPNGGPLVPFRGYCVTHPDAPVVFSMEGTLVATTAQDIAIPAGYTVIANSWTAPIDINAITDDDMEGISDKSIYFFNTGSDADGNHGTGTEAGTYRTTPIHSASYTGDWQIPSMQGFYISTASDGTFHLDYERHVRPTGSRSVVSNPMYAPRRAAAESDEPNVLKIFARGSRYQDKLIVLEREDFTRGYDSGWDGEAWGGGTLSPMVYVTGEGREDAVSAIPEFEGTVVAFKAGEDSEYRFEFTYSEDAEPLYLLDTENNTYTQVITGNAYYFTTTDKVAHSRFVLTRKNPQIATDIEPVSGSPDRGKAKKLLIEDKMFIMVNGMLYDATGKVVK